MALCGPEVEKQVPAEPRPGRKLQSWWSLVFCLCFYGFMSQMRPGESFITPYLLGPDKNFTQQQGLRKEFAFCSEQGQRISLEPD